MANDNDSDPFERYFRPRPNGRQSSADPEPGEGEPDGVIVDGARAPRVEVGSPRRRRRGAARSAMNARRQRRFLMVTATMSAFVLLTSGGAWAFQGFMLGQIEKIDPFDGLGNRPDAGPKGAMNILVAGVDRREGMKPDQIRRLRLGKFEGERSDTMMLVHLSADHDKVSVVSLPRDSLVTIPAHRSNGSEGAKGASIPSRQGKLNWAYTYGGSTLTIETVEQTTGVRIDHYVEVNFLGFIKVVDALGGVKICTEQPIDDPKSGLRLPAGPSHVDGEKALAYARARYTLTGGSDLGRIDRQQQFMSALMSQALSTSTLTDPVKATRFVKAMLKSIRVDKGLADDAQALLRQMKGLSTDSVAFTSVPLADTNFMTPINGSQPQSTVRWDQQGARDLFQKLRRDQPLIAPAPSASPTPTKAADELTVRPADIQVRVLNGVGTRGVARGAADDLRRAGFNPIVVPGVAKQIGQKQTVIQYGGGRADSAKTLAAAIPGARVKRLPSLGDRIQVIVGSSWDGAKKVKVAGPAGEPGTGAPALQARTATQNLCK
ncbi:LCP family protein [Actinomadura sp. HBU206391]|uniref:LCP family protein n=1 Tax=Actinomadura sp. HBU206391 TaxID=2731692 RepID=UPI00165042CD|nr:LCP family protein [Actinomadura sp. HBU206391]MBC6458140.1 LCP family protein [Actinomadura sp. HBU206391]